MPIGICFEPLEPRLLLSGSWVTGVEASSADSQSATESGFGAVTATISDGPETIGLDALSQNQHALGAGTFVDVLADAPVLNTFDADRETNSGDNASETALTSDTTVSATDNALAAPINDLSGNASNTAPQIDLTERTILRELILVNENVADYQQLIADLQGENANRVIEVVVLDADRDGIEQVSDILADRSDLTAVHFIAHGTGGQINLGNTWLNSAILQQNIDPISEWGKALTGAGDILFYGCNIAADGAGQSLLNTIADLTGADVAASDDLTGSAKSGGDWVLEYENGEIETDVALRPEVRQNWSGVLGQITVTTSNDILDSDADTSSLANLELNPGSDGLVSLREAVVAANQDSDADTIFLPAGNYQLSLTGANESDGSQW